MLLADIAVHNGLFVTTFSPIDVIPSIAPFASPAPKNAKLNTGSLNPYNGSIGCSPNILPFSSRIIPLLGSAGNIALATLSYTGSFTTTS